MKADDLATGSVTDRSVRQNAVGRGELDTNSVYSRHLGTGVVRRRELGIASVTSTAIRNRSVGSFDLGVQSRIDFPMSRSILGGLEGLRLVGERIALSPSEEAPAAVEFLSQGAVGGSLHLDGSLEPGSGFLRLTETAQTPNTFSSSVSLFVREEAGVTQLLALLPTGAVVQLAP